MPLRDIIARPNFLTAVVAAMVGYGTMNLVMASTPLQMMMCGFGVNATADVIRAHSIAMFLPGFVTGRLIQRFGAHPVILGGAAAYRLCVAVNIGFGPFFSTFIVALMLLGVGWNFMFVGATALLASAHEPRNGCGCRRPTTSSCSARWQRPPSPPARSRRPPDGAR